MKYTSALLDAACCAIALSSCGGEQPKTEQAAEAVSPAAVRQSPSLSVVTTSPEFPGATLTIASVKAEKVGNDSAKVSFNFDVKNYELKMQTSDNANKLCNNSAQGQHIHFIMDNAPYKALYEPTNTITLANGTEHYLMAFLSRSYHESVKSKGAALVYHFKIDEKGKLVKLDEPKTPMLFYSRPKGDYIGTDTANLLLDYYVWNCDLATDGYKVKATLQPAGGVPEPSVSFTLDKWEPKFINNLTTGKSKLELVLIDKDGKQVEGPSTSVIREFNLSAGEPLK